MSNVAKNPQGVVASGGIPRVRHSRFIAGVSWWSLCAVWSLRMGLRLARR
jgi:hypothetical protein